MEMGETRIADGSIARGSPAEGAQLSVANAGHARPTRTTISLFGNFGTQNLGNEYTLQAFLRNLRRHAPGAAVNCICPGPEDASARHHLPAFRMSYRYGAGFNSGAKRRSNHPVVRLLRRCLVRIPLELIEWVKAYNALKGTSMLVMPGTGMLGDFGIGPFDLHYEILKWSILAKARGSKVLFVSVGAGPIEHPLSRWIVKRAVSLADYRSYRDSFSKAYLAAIGFDTRRDLVYPDLAFSLRPEIAVSERRKSDSLVIGLGLMDYFGKHWTGSSEATYFAYVDKAAIFLQWLLDRDYTVRLLIGDVAYDRRVKVDVMEALRKRRPDHHDGRIIDEPISSVEELIAQLGKTDIVVATRFHNLLLALMLNKPVLALSYHEKIASLMAGVGMDAYCEDVEALDVDRLIERFLALEQDADAVKALIGRKMDEYGAALDQQYAHIFNQLCSGRRMALAMPERMARLEVFGKSPLGFYLRLNEWIWNRLPAATTALPPFRSYGHFLHSLVRLQSIRQMSLGTFFLRNRPELELVQRLASLKGTDRPVKLAVLGASNGAEVYSFVWAIRSARPSLKLVAHAVDISAAVLESAREGVYSLGGSELVDEPIFERMTEMDMEDMLDRKEDRFPVKPWIREGIAWHVGDAGDPRMRELLGPQDVVVANRFLCHMGPVEAEACLRNIARLVVPGGHLFVSGIDLDVRTKVAIDLGWKPVRELMEEIHEGDPSLRRSWPCKYWGLEPIDKNRPDWGIRYASVFQLGERVDGSAPMEK